MKTVLITGGTRGIGRATAKVFSAHHYQLVLVYHENEEEAKKLEQALLKEGTPVLLLKGDLAKEEEITRIVHEAYQKFGKIDCLVNNAAIAMDTIVEDKTKDNFLKTLDVNLIAPFLLSRAVGNRMQQEGNGIIINVASTNGIDTPYPESLDYDCSKAGLISLTHNLAHYYGPTIRVNAVAPGWVQTEMNASLEDNFIKEEEKHILLKRFATPKEIAQVIYFLASEDASYINDTVIRVDGGIKR